MSIINSRVVVKRVLASMLLLGIGLCSSFIPATAQTKQQKFRGFFAPPGKSMPAHSEGGASRGRCQQDLSQAGQAVRLVIPESHTGLTVSSRPVFLAHVEKSQAKQVFFSLKNADESYFYEMTAPLPSEGGMVQLKLPEDAPELQVGESYQWSVAVICGEKLGPDSPWASAGIERVDPSGEAAIASKLSPVEQASLYGEQGLWYDTAATLANWSTQDPNAASPAWQALLEAEGLDKIADTTTAPYTP